MRVESAKLRVRNENVGVNRWLALYICKSRPPQKSKIQMVDLCRGGSRTAQFITVLLRNALHINKVRALCITTPLAGILTKIFSFLRNNLPLNNLKSVFLFTLLTFALFTPAYAQNVVVETVEFVGAETFTEAQLRKLIDTKESHWYDEIFRGKAYLKPKLLSSDLEQIKLFYRSKGFLDPEIKASIDVIEGKKARVQIIVNEGRRCKFDKIELSGFKGFNPPFKPEGYQHSGWFDFTSPTRLEKAAANYFANRGHPYAEVEASYSLSQDSTSVSLSIQATPNKKAYFGPVTIWGIDVTQKKVVTRELTWERGEIYNRSKLNKSRENLYGTGLFALVRITPESLEAKPDTLPVKIALVERKSHFLSMDASFATNPNYDLTTDISAEVGHRNLFGTGRKLTLRLTGQFQLFSEFRNLKNRVALTYSDPYLLHIKTPLYTEIYFDPGNRSESEQYRIQRTGIKAHLSFPVNSVATHRFSFTSEWVDIYGIKSEEIAREIKVSKGIRIERKIEYLFSRDSRDDLFFPTRGSNTKVILKFAGLGGDENYLKGTGEWSRFITFTDYLIYANRIKVGMLTSTKQEKPVLPHNRFYLGGGRSIRGFAEKALGPKDKYGAPRGGNYLFLTNFELRFHLFYKFWSTLFVDVGNLWEDVDEVKLTQLRVTGGWGISLRTPVGPIRFDYAYHLRKLDEPVEPRWHLGVLYAF